MSFLATLAAVAQLLPVINNLVLAVEAIHPGTGQGANKLNTVLNTVQGAMAATGQAAVTYEQLKPAITTAVSGIVSTYNAAGGVPAVAVKDSSV